MDTKQLALNFKHRARRTDPETSHIAAAGSSHRPANNERILAALKSLYGYRGTCYEIAKAAEMTHIEVARRMKMLEETGYVIRSALRRAGASGYPCTVWELVQK